MKTENSRSYYESNYFSRRWRLGLASMVSGLLPEARDSIRLLDIGSGDGYTIRLVRPEGAITGIDPDSDMAPLAASRGIDFRVGSAYHIPFDEKSFDVATCIEVLEHLERPAQAIAELRRVVVDGGFVVVTTPVPGALWRLLWWGWTRFGPGKRWDTTPHVSDIHLHDGGDGRPGLESLLEGQGFKIEAEASCNFGMVAGVRARAQ